MSGFLRCQPASWQAVSRMLCSQVVFPAVHQEPGRCRGLQLDNVCASSTSTPHVCRQLQASACDSIASAPNEWRAKHSAPCVNYPVFDRSVSDCSVFDYSVFDSSGGGSCAQDKLTTFLRGCGYNPKKDIAYVPISGLYGDNIKKSVDVEKLA